jgi:hypothetical protein
MAGAAGVDPALDLTQMARLTGGHAYFRQDIRAVLKQVITNAGASFDIAYAPPADNWDSKFHVIRVACSRPGVRLQLRERYYALADARPPGERMKAALMQAFQSPGDFTEIGVRTKLSLGTRLPCTWRPASIPRISCCRSRVGSIRARYIA